MDRANQLQPLSLAGTVLLKSGTAVWILAHTAGAGLRMLIVLPGGTANVATPGATGTKTGSPN